MRSGLLSQALRRHRWSLLAPACTQALAACVISAMVMTAWSLEHSALSDHDRAVVAASDIEDVTAAFIGISIYLSLLIVGVTMNLAIHQQVEDLALVRVVGASPGQIRRAVAIQAAAVAAPASVIGWLIAIPAGAAWVHALKEQSVLPGATAYAPHVVALPIALAIGLGTSVVGALLASGRTARIAPRRALTEAATRRRPVGGLRIVLGVTLVAGAAALSTVLATSAPSEAADAAFFVMLAESVGCGMLGPLILARVAATFRHVATDGVPRLALDHIETMTRSLSGALIPLLLAAAFTTVKVAVHTTTARATGMAEPAADVWMDYSGTAIYGMFAAAAALNCLVTVTVNRRPDLAAMRLLGASRRAIVGMMLLESVIVAGTAVVLAAAVAGVTLAPMLHTAVGRWLPYVPAPLVGTGVLVVAAIVAAGMAGTAAVVTRASPIRVVAAGP